MGRPKLDSNAKSKRCPKCRRLKRIESFGLNSNRGGGRETYCRPCKYLMKKAYMETRADVPDATAVSRFLAKVEKRADGCWI